jgi:hypothetical protein
MSERPIKDGSKNLTAKFFPDKRLNSCMKSSTSRMARLYAIRERIILSPKN